MPVLPQQQTIVQYVTNVSQFVYTFAFYAPLATDIQVFYQAPNVTPIPASQLLVLNVNYTVTFNADPTTGGLITLLFTPTTGYYLTINRQVAASLTTNFADAQTFNGANLDAALDRLLLLCQQNLNYALQRNLSYVINTYLPNAVPFTQLPPLPLNYFWVGSGSGVVAAQIATIPSASVLQSLLASNAPGADGGLLVGFYDYYASNSTNVSTLLNYRNVPANDAGLVNALAITIAPTYTAYISGSSFEVKAAVTNTGATTLNVNAIGIKNIVKQSPVGIVALQGGELVAGNVYQLFYDGTQFQLLNPSVSAAYSSAVYNLTTSQSLLSNTQTLLIWDTTDYVDPYSIITFVGSGAQSMRVITPGLYEINVCVQATATPTPSLFYILIYLNGSLYQRLDAELISGSAGTFNGTIKLRLSAITNDIQIYGQFVGTNGTINPGSASNFFQMTYLGN